MKDPLANLVLNPVVTNNELTHVKAEIGPMTITVPVHSIVELRDILDKMLKVKDWSVFKSGQKWPQ